MSCAFLDWLTPGAFLFAVVLVIGACVFCYFRGGTDERGDDREPWMR